MRIIDMMGITAARSTWGTCSLNEFRKSLGLEQFTEFKREWCFKPSFRLHLSLTRSLPRLFFLRALSPAVLFFALPSSLPSEWDSDPKIVDIARRLYTHIDNVERESDSRLGRRPR
jgi:hypothetical protein